ncbi:amidase [Mangrovicoccus algicola]|uniref:Amidase n=1 Tax=Mangrovicoccus algicola TaxID=2771008 RepID=A0A8J6Z8S2_9RHOB|nr:amidase family protein [Mangrovicoccus algicola]MBE3637946.1 amidase [Mangrovicoccus algicola]
MTGQTPTPADPADLSALEARRLIARRRLSPVELAEACIARVETLDHAVNAMPARDFDRLRDGAKAAEAAVAAGGPLGALHGLPLAVKDMEDMAGLPTTFGSPAYRDNLPEADGAPVAELAAAGALPMGKTNVPEWSAGANSRNLVYGTTANPHDVTKTCAGSSGGSAVALACGYAPLATGSDMGGSLRNPAAHCGVVGFRPSPGVVPGEARATALLPLSTSGPMARSVADAGLMLSVMSRPGRDDPFSVEVEGRTAWDPAGFAALPRVDLSGLRIAATEDFGFAPTESTVRDQFRNAMGQLGPFLGRVEETAPDCRDADRIFGVLRGISFLGIHAELLDRAPHHVGPNVRDNVLEGRSYSGEDVARALIAQGEYHRRWQAFFGDWDILVSPAITVSPRPWRELYPAQIDGQPTKTYFHWLALAYATTIAGHPSISIPCGRDAKGMPFGLQLVGRRHDDRRLLAVAAEIEAVIAGLPDLAPRGPDLAMLAAAPPIAEAEGFLSFD